MQPSDPTNQRPKDKPPDTTEEERTQAPPPEEEPLERTSWRQTLRAAYRRARVGSGPRRTELNTRGEKNVDRSKTFLLLAAATVIVGFAFLVLFSTPGSEKRAGERRTKPSLGRPQVAPGQKGPGTGSVAPLLSADPTTGEQSGDVSPEDILATSRRTRQQRPVQAISSTPVVKPAVKAYRRPVSPPIQAAKPAAPVPVKSESEILGKPSLVFVRNQASITGQSGRLAEPHPASMEKSVTTLLPVGTKLLARLQSAVSSAVKTPVVATIEYNYERDGEIVLPAGAKAFGTLQQANQQGQVDIRFHTLQLPNGSTGKIEGSAMSLEHGSLKGHVSGRSRGTKILVRSLTGVGTIAAYMVGGRGGVGGLRGPLDNSALLRERLASNVAVAGEQEMMNLAYQQNAVITVPGNTRFYIVLQEAVNSTEEAGTTDLAGIVGQGIPTAAELRELIDLKRELQQLDREVSASRTVIDAPSQDRQRQ